MSSRAGYPRDTAGNWDGLAVKQFQWARLTGDVNAAFTTGTIVCIVDASPASISPTKYPEQSNVWRKTDADTAYKVAKLVEEDVVYLYPCEDSGGAIVHRYLAPTPRGSPALQGYKAGEIVYLLPSTSSNPPRDHDYFLRIPSRNKGPGVPYRIPDGACGIIKGRTTRAGGYGAAEKLKPSANGALVLRDRYIVLFAVRFKRRRWVPCSVRLNQRAYLELFPDRNAREWESAAQCVDTPFGPEVVRADPETVRTAPLGTGVTA